MTDEAPKDVIQTHSATVRGDALPWWHQLVTTATLSPLFDSQRAIFCNRTLRFDKVKAVGFDFDHTLAVYNCETLDNLAMKLVIDRLIEHEDFKASDFDGIPEAEFATKGLIVDTELGNVLKIDRFGHVARAYHGDQRLRSAEKREVYGASNVIPHVSEGGRYLQIDSAFAKPEVRIFAKLSPTFGNGEKSRRPLWKMIRSHTDMIHRDGSLKKFLMANPLEYLHPDLDTISMLRHLKESGKEVFLLTNSEWEYTKAMAGPALGLSHDPEISAGSTTSTSSSAKRRSPSTSDRRPTAPASPSATDA